MTGPLPVSVAEAFLKIVVAICCKSVLIHTAFTEDARAGPQGSNMAKINTARIEDKPI
jgi:hypothetical protein